MNENEPKDPDIYLVQIKKTGEAICTCEEWNKKTPGKPRSCKHTKELADEHKITEKYGWYGDDAKEEIVEEPAVPAGPVLIQPMFPIVTTKEFNPLKYTSTEYSVQEKHSGIRLLVVILEGDIVAKGFALVRGEVKDLGEQTLPEHILNGLKKFPDGAYDAQLFLEGGKTEDISKVSNPELLSLVLIDILNVTNNSMIQLPYYKRREQLEELFWLSDPTPEDAIFLAPSVPATPEAINEILSRPGFGALVKNNNSIYSYGITTPPSKKLQGNTTVFAQRWVLFNPPKTKQLKSDVKGTEAVLIEDNDTDPDSQTEKE